jgi:hypothetical protein
MAAHPEIALLLDALDEAFDHKSWHGTNLRGSIRSLTAEHALWRPAPGRHNIWELALHAAYWKYAVRRQITQADRGSFPLKGSNFFPRNGGDAAAWKADIRLLVDQHRLLRDMAAALNPSFLHRKAPHSKYAVDFILRGAAAHDLYHAGQIQLLKRLQRPS